ncbi:MAG: MgtC/SapB family protein [Clostridia bacterium]|nr:MgtC/SapB family protein [Clostridia bacterium]
MVYWPCRGAFRRFHLRGRNEAKTITGITGSLTFGAVALRLLLAMLCGGAVGYGRSRRERPAGLRTYMLIGIGAASAVILALYQYEMLTHAWKSVSDEVGMKYDASRLAAQTVTGIGFLGAGIIIKASHQQVKGLTTAAGLWTTGIIGLAIGSGYYELAFLGTVMVLLAETVFSTLGAKIRHDPDYHVEIHYREKNSLDSVLRYCKDSRMDIVNLRIHSVEIDPSAGYVAEVHLCGSMQCGHLVDHIQRMPGIVSAIGL